MLNIINNKDVCKFKPKLAPANLIVYKVGTQTIVLNILILLNIFFNIPLNLKPHPDFKLLSNMVGLLKKSWLGFAPLKDKNPISKSNNKLISIKYK